MTQKTGLGKDAIDGCPFFRGQEVRVCGFGNQGETGLVSDQFREETHC